MRTRSFMKTTKSGSVKLNRLIVRLASWRWKTNKLYLENNRVFLTIRLNTELKSKTWKNTTRRFAFPRTSLFSYNKMRTSFLRWPSNETCDSKSKSTPTSKHKSRICNWSRSRWILNWLAVKMTQFRLWPLISNLKQNMCNNLSILRCNPATCRCTKGEQKTLLEAKFRT